MYLPPKRLQPLQGRQQSRRNNSTDSASFISMCLSDCLDTSLQLSHIEVQLHLFRCFRNSVYLFSAQHSTHIFSSIGTRTLKQPIPSLFTYISAPLSHPSCLSPSSFSLYSVCAFLLSLIYSFSILRTAPATTRFPPLLTSPFVLHFLLFPHNAINALLPPCRIFFPYAFLLPSHRQLPVHRVVPR